MCWQSTDILSLNLRWFTHTSQVKLKHVSRCKPGCLMLPECKAASAYHSIFAVIYDTRVGNRCKAPSVMVMAPQSEGMSLSITSPPCLRPLNSINTLCVILQSPCIIHPDQVKQQDLKQQSVHRHAPSQTTHRAHLWYTSCSGRPSTPDPNWYGFETDSHKAEVMRDNLSVGI